MSMPDEPLQQPTRRAVRVVDGGYISWVYGSSPLRWAAWNPLKFLGWIVAMDSVQNIRKVVEPSYKQKREDKRASDPGKLAVKERVDVFKEAVNNDPRLCRLELHGLEADDVVALLAWKYPGTRVIGGDKDLLQLLPWLASFKGIDDEPYTVARYHKRLPDSCADLKLTPELIPLSLSLMGDKSDSIPRLIPPYRLEIFRNIVRDRDPYKRAQEKFGEDFLRNLQLVALPYPGVFGCKAEETYDLLRSGFWKPDALMPNLRPDLAAALEQVIVEARTLYQRYLGEAEEAMPTLSTEERAQWAALAAQVSAGA